MSVAFRTLRASLAGLLALWLMLGGGAATSWATTETDDAETEQTEPSSSESAQPLLSIAVQRTGGEVQSDDAVTYTAVLENLGEGAVDATVVVSVPEYVTLASESAPAAVVAGTEATWVSTIEGNDAAEFVIDAVIGTIPDTERRVTTVVSVFVGDPAELIVRTADAANIVGVDDVPSPAAEQAADEAATADDRLLLTVGLVATAALFVVLLVVTIVVVRKTRASKRSRPGRRSTGGKP